MVRVRVRDGVRACSVRVRRSGYRVRVGYTTSPSSDSGSVKR